MSEQNYSDAAGVLNEVITAFQKVNPDDRERLLQTVATFFGVGAHSPSGPVAYHPQVAQGVPGPVDDVAFSEDRSMSPKEFLAQKQPQTDVEKVACLAYYLAHYRGVQHFKTIDISQLNTEAAQIKLSNAAYAVDNAAKMGYLAPSTKGSKQISAAGERFVRELPDREAAKAAMKSVLPRRRSRKQSEDSSNKLLRPRA
ncbi:MAG TPA: hypothetical protein VFZ08_04470 [Terriglobia bacterium]|nr:hypothetical protein [Terriglobia bacterium]